MNTIFDGSGAVNKNCRYKRRNETIFLISVRNIIYRPNNNNGKNRVLVGKPEVKYHFEDLGLEGRIILKWIFRSGRGAWTGLILLRIGRVGELYASCNKLPLSIKCGQFRD